MYGFSIPVAGNKEEFAKMLELMRGGRSLNQFSNDAEVSPTQIAGYLRCLVDTPMSRETLMKLIKASAVEVDTAHVLNVSGIVALEDVLNVK